MTDEAVAIARLEAQMNYLLQDWESVKVVLLERSGDIVKMGTFERDLNSLGNKVRAIDLRVGTVEKRVDRTFWVGAGVVAVLQILAWAAPYAIKSISGGAQ